MNIVKRKACLIPYRNKNGIIEVYLSHRSKTAKQYPDYSSFWGGAIEDGETPEQAMLRELEEELEWQPKEYTFLGVYFDSMPNEKHIYFCEVEGNFEGYIKVNEGQGGKFFLLEEIQEHEMIIKEDKKAIFDLFCRLK